MKAYGKSKKKKTEYIMYLHVDLVKSNFIISHKREILQVLQLKLQVQMLNQSQYGYLVFTMSLYSVN
jgi:hypothetical protein